MAKNTPYHSKHLNFEINKYQLYSPKLDQTNLSLEYILYTRKFLYEHLTPASWLRNNLCEFTTREHKFNERFCTQITVLNVRFKDFWYTKIYIV